MKKLMTALAVCLAAGFVAATGGGVVSSNVVGYVTIPVNLDVNGTKMMGVPLLNMTTNDGTYSATTVFQGQVLNSSDQILPFDGAAYNFGAYVAVGDGTWTVYDAFFNEVTKPAGWVPTFEIGSAFVMQYASGSGTNVIVGQVQNDQTTTFTYDMTAPFSSKLPIDVTAQDFVGVLQNSDQILTFDAVNYNFESYIFDGVSTFTHYDAFFNEMPPVSGSMVILPIGTGAIFIGNGDAESAPRVWLQHANL